jgi:hypothetical protein
MAPTETIPAPSPRDMAIDQVAKTLHLDRVEAAGLVDLLVLAAVHEAGERIAESLLEPLAVATSKGADEIKAALHRAHVELAGVQP